MNRASFALRAAAMLLLPFTAAVPVVAQDNPPRSMDILPLVDVQRPPGDAELGQRLVDSYVRLEIARVAEREEVERSYDNEMRSSLSRFFVGRTTSRVLKARFAVSGTTPISAIVTLAAAAQRSNRRDGENFTSELSERRMVTPYFRVDAGAEVSMAVELVSSRKADADITRNFLSVIESATRLVAPSSSLVTSITAPRMNNAASFADQAISQLFTETIAETAYFEVPVRNWSDDGQGSQDIGSITALFPFRTDRPERELLGLGHWTVSLSPPVLSIFTETALSQPGRHDEQPYQQLRLDFAQLSPALVLGYRLDDGITLGEAIRGDDGVSAALLRFDTAAPATADQKKNTAVIVELCSRIAERTRGLGFNRYDVAASVWAVTWSGILRPELAGALWENEDGRYLCDAIQLAAELGLSRPSASDLTLVGNVTIGEIRTQLGTVRTELGAVRDGLGTVRNRVEALETQSAEDDAAERERDRP